MTRDTDADWGHIAETEPYFGVLANPAFLQENLDAASIEEFYASGRTDIAYVVQTIRQHLDSDFAPQLAVDFGCGVGRLSLAMRDYAASVVGVDVAPGMRSLATQRAQETGMTAVSFTETAPESGVGWLNSLIVFQHIPPARGMVILKQLVAAISAGGVVSIQITTHRDGRHLHEIFRDVSEARYDGTRMDVLDARSGDEVGHMSMFDYDLGAVLALLTREGFERFWLDHTDHGGVHGFWIFARRSVGGST